MQYMKNNGKREKTMADILKPESNLALTLLLVTFLSQINADFTKLMGPLIGAMMGPWAVYTAQELSIKKQKYNSLKKTEKQIYALYIPTIILGLASFALMHTHSLTEWSNLIAWATLGSFIGPTSIAVKKGLENQNRLLNFDEIHERLKYGFWHINACYDKISITFDHSPIDQEKHSSYFKQVTLQFVIINTNHQKFTDATISVQTQIGNEKPWSSNLSRSEMSGLSLPENLNAESLDMIKEAILLIKSILCLPEKKQKQLQQMNNVSLEIADFTTGNFDITKSAFLWVLN